MHRFKFEELISQIDGTLICKVRRVHHTWLLCLTNTNSLPCRICLVMEYLSKRLTCSLCRLFSDVREVCKAVKWISWVRWPSKYSYIFSRTLSLICGYNFYLWSITHHLSIPSQLLSHFYRNSWHLQKYKIQLTLSISNSHGTREFVWDRENSR